VWRSAAKYSAERTPSSRSHLAHSLTPASFLSLPPYAQLIGHGATISAPHMHAVVLEALYSHVALREGARVLDVGSGSGYLVAAFSHLLPPAPLPSAEDAAPAPAPSPAPSVHGIEHMPELVEWSLANLARDPSNAASLASGRVSVCVGDGYAGLPSIGPFTAIHVGAAAPSIPEALVAQLAPGGRMVIPVGTTAQELLQVDKDAGGKVEVKSLMGVRYVPLTTREKQEEEAGGKRRG
jgi:protein-L-isoaspartate(D-aspartate) O-methyltransferase